MTRAELGRRNREASYLTGEFVLRSGQVSDRYLDKHLFEAEPGLLRDEAEGRSLHPLFRMAELTGS